MSQTNKGNLMANVSISMVNIRQILRLSGENYSRSEISILLGVSRKTISKYMSIAQSSGMGYSDISELSDKEISDIFLKKEEPDKDRLAIIQQRMPEFEKDLSIRGVTKFLLWEEYKSTYPGGYNYTQFCHYLNIYLKKNEAVMHFDHKAGDKVFIDFTGQKIPITD
jgi:predicted transcriptional regulator